MRADFYYPIPFQIATLISSLCPDQINPAISALVNLLNKLIDYIEVDSQEVVDGERQQEIRIEYRFEGEGKSD